MLRRLALEHLARALGVAVLHERRGVAVVAPAPHEGLDVDLVEAGRVEGDPARLLEVRRAQRRAQRRLRERHRAAHALRVRLVDAKGDHEVEQLEVLARHAARDALGRGEERVRNALLARQREAQPRADDLAVLADDPVLCRPRRRPTWRSSGAQGRLASWRLTSTFSSKILLLNQPGVFEHHPSILILESFGGPDLFLGPLHLES
jgi:hypothetical protein